ncbi:MAG TPA: hypothetical protein VFP50_07725 [Anaeromyxobacteraceae bacterium]|nr:hypothetical protein [Anaeromyxobacteraceae bacterium]
MRTAHALLLAAALAGCATATRAPSPPPTGLDEAAGRAVLLRFAGACEAGRWTEAYALLSPRWRAATTPERLAADWRGAGPVAREAAARVASLLRGGAHLEPLAASRGRLVLAVGPGRAARLVEEGGGWRVDALE